MREWFRMRLIGTTDLYGGDALPKPVKLPLPEVTVASVANLMRYPSAAETRIRRDALCGSNSMWRRSYCSISC
jgi:hypothetical protein